MSPISDNLAACVLVLNDEFFLPYVLEASRGYFSRYVIYDVGSTDRTRDIIHWFMESNQSASYFIREFDCVPPRLIQGVFRNSQIAETKTDYYYILDGDEIYADGFEILTKKWHAGRRAITGGSIMKDKLYGVIRRVEISPDLTKRYSSLRTHHRIYHRLAIFDGPHPGERPLIEQKPNNEIHIPEVLCHHFHNAERSSKESDALKRQERKQQHTYHPGELLPYDLLKELPILRKPIEDFPVAPALRKLQNEYKLSV